MISLKRYLDGGAETGAREDSCFPEVLEAYVASLAQMRESGALACPGRAQELERGMKRILESLERTPTRDSVVDSEPAVRELLQDWGRQVASHYDQKAADVRDLLLVMSRTAESLGNKDDRIARRIDCVTEQLASIANLEDVSRMRASVEASACELRESVKSMAAEGKALIEHLRAEVSTYQTKLENAERVASCDALTGLGSRRWVEGRIQGRMEAGTPFSIVLVDINGFHSAVEAYGNLVGDMLLKEFAKELRSACRFTDIVGRWGNDEFMLLVDEVGDEIESKVDRLRTSSCRRYHVPGRTGYVSVPLTVSVGVAEHEAGEDVQTLLERADRDLSRERAERLRNSA